MSASCEGPAPPKINSVETGVPKPDMVTKDAIESGKAVTDGIAKGLEAGKPKVLAAGEDLASDLKKKFKISIDAHSPSRVFASYGEDITDGVALGVTRGSPDARKAVEEMVSAPKPSGASVGGASSAAAPVHVELHFHVASEGAAKTLREPSFLGQLTKAVEEALVGAGMPVQGQGSLAA